MFDVRLRLSLLAAACALSWTMLGCASNQQSSSKEPTAVLYNKEKVVCKRDYPTGSNIARTRCYRRSDAAARRASDQAQIETIKLGGAVVTKPGGG